MSIGESIKLIKEVSNHNGIPIQSIDKQLDVTEIFGIILSKRKPKVNCVVLYGASSAGKTILLKSAFKVFPGCTLLYQGVSNNFMFESLENAQVCLWDEDLFGAQHQESTKKLLGSEEFESATKYRRNVKISRAIPVGIGGNVLPWSSILTCEHRKAFGNRCIVVEMSEMPTHADYSNKGVIHPQAWLSIDKPYWARVNGQEEVPQSQENSPE